MLHFIQLNHPRHMDIYVQDSKHKRQNTEVTIFEHRTQNICIQNTMSHRLPYNPILNKRTKDDNYINFVSKISENSVYRKFNRLLD